MHSLVLAALTIMACMSPLLTLAWLWQVKEWRWDRLREHLRHSGVMRQLWGVVRPIVVLSSLTVLLTETWWQRFLDIPVPFVAGTALGLLSGLSIIQSIFGQQRVPRWTKKASAIVLFASVLNILTIAFMASDRWLYIFLPLTVILQPLFLGIGCAAVYPLDQALKLRIMRRAKEARLQHSALTVIAITGSVGKTTTKELLAHILAKKLALITPAHVNTEMGVAQWMTNVLHSIPDDATQIVITEMGAYRRGEIALLCSIVQPTIGIITYVGEQHLALFGSRQNIVDAKGELFVSLPLHGHAFVNADNEAARQLIAKCRCAVTTIGTESGVDLLASNIEETGKGIRFTVEHVLFDVPLFGTHQTANVLLAIACARSLGMSLDEISTQLRSFHTLSRTFEVRTVSGVRVLDDTHNASPQSFLAGLEWAKQQPEKTKVLLTSGIIELGQAEKPIHEKLALIASNIFEQAYITDEHLMPSFANAFQGRASLMSPNARSLQEGALLVCIGRMSERTMNQLLPSVSPEEISRK